MKYVQEVTTFLLGYLLILPLLLLVTGVNCCVRFVIWCYFFFTKDVFAPAMDNLLQITSHNGTIVVVLYTAEQEVELEKERKFVETSILGKVDKNGNQVNKKLRYIWTEKFGYGCWRDTGSDFDINHHVRELKTEKKGGFLTERQFLTEILNPLTEAMSLNRPQWEWILVGNVLNSDGEPRTARIFRCHHSIMDGVSIGLLLVGSVLSFPEESGSPFVVDPFLTLPLKMKVLQSLESLTAPLFLPWMLAEAFTNSQIAPEDPFNTKAVYTGRTHLAQSRLLESSLFRRIKEHGGPHLTVPTIVGTVLCQAISKWLPDNSRGRKGTFIKVETPTALLPVRSWAPCNYFLYSATHFEAKSEILIPFVLDSWTWVTRAFCGWAGQLPISLGRALCQPNDFAATVVLTNVPFTRVQGYLEDCRVESLTTFAGLMKPTTLFVVVTRYGSVFRFCAQVEDSIMSEEELQRFVDDMAEGVVEMGRNPGSKWRQDDV